MADENLSIEQKRMFRFLHTGLAIISLIWIAICLLVYFHAPSFQSHQVFDCRWYLAALAIQALFGHIFVFRSQTVFIFVATFVANQYAIVYSCLTLVIYGMDTLLLMVANRPTMISYVPYLKLTSVLIVLSSFGVALSLVHMHRLFLLVRQICNTTNNTTSTPLSSIRTFRALTGGQTILALLSVYVAASLIPMKLWYVRVHMVQEFSCSLLAVTLALLQFVVFHNASNWNCSLLLKGIVIANGCQLVQELNMALSAFYTLFYVDRVFTAVEERQEMFEINDPHLQLALARAHRAKSLLALNLMLHIGRMVMNGFLAFHLANRVFAEPLSLRVKFKVDSELANAEQSWEEMRRKEKKWLYSIAACVLAIGIAHMLLNIGYVWGGMIFESLSVATGLSFVFAMCLVLTIGLYSFKLLRFFLILSAYISLNLLITATLLLFSFIQDFFFLATALDQDDEKELLRLNTTLNGTLEPVAEEQGEDASTRLFLYFADFALAIGTFLVAGFTIRYAIRTLIKTKQLQTQPTNVQRAIRILHALALVGLVSSAIEIFMLAELRLEGRGKFMAHSSINTSFYDWLLSSSQFLFLFYVTRYERFQALLPVQLLQLASISATTLDLIGQQTETLQIYINNVLQFYRVTEVLMQRTAEAGSDSPGSNAIFITQPMGYTVPLHLFVDILALHFIQIIQWFLTVAALVIGLYAFDNMVEAESDQVNDFHELRSNGERRATGAGEQQMAAPSDPVPSNNQQQENAPAPSTNVANKFSTLSSMDKADAQANKMTFDNKLYQMNDE